MKENDPRIAEIKPDTRVLYRIKGRNNYLMTNEEGQEEELLRVFSADKHGVIEMEGYLLGSIYAHDPYIIPELKKVDCLFSELNPKYFDRDYVTDGLIGQAVGDAFGVPFEFMSRAELQKLNPDKMEGSDTRHSFSSRWGNMIPKGAWSDDTSMTVAEMASMINNDGRIDYDDIMREFFAWWNDGRYSSLSFPFGLGNNISHAMKRFEAGTPALDCGGKGFRDHGNGALMRMFPFSVYCIVNNLNDSETLSIIKNAAGITHGHEINMLSCYIYTQFLYDCIRTKNPKFAFIKSIYHNITHYRENFSEESLKAHDALFKMDAYKPFDVNSVAENGYVVNSLTIAVFSMLHTDNYEDAIKTAVSFGYDTDTNAAITGSIAGAVYGMNQIPKKWLDCLLKKDELMQLGKQFGDVINP